MCPRIPGAKAGLSCSDNSLPTVFSMPDPSTMGGFFRSRVPSTIRTPHTQNQPGAHPNGTRPPPQKKPQFLDQAHRIAPGKRIRPPGTLGTRRGRDRNGTSPPRARKPPLREIGPHPLPSLASAAGAAGGLETIEACGIGSGRIRRSNRGEDRGGSPRILIFLSLSLIFSPSPPSAPRLLCAGGGEGRGAEEERALPLFLSLSLAGRG
jgi:hypothetical protein